VTTGVVRSHGRKDHDRRQRWAEWPVVRRLREQGEAWGGPHQATRRQLGIRWWREILLIGLFYFGYNLVRNHFGSAAVGPGLALNNAEIVIELERALGLYFESTMQGWFLGWDAFISIWNVFYGLLHFSVTFFTLVWLYLKFPEVYQRWRTTGLVCTGLGLLGFALFPLMPPRLLNDCSAFGACDSNYSYVDTLVDPGGFWSFNSSAMMDISNQYAAMPSLHIAWAVWCVVAALPVLRRRWVRLGLLAYPWLTLFAVMVTANHFWLDAVGGLLAVAVAHPAGVLLARRLPAWLAPRPAGAAGP